MSPSVIARPKTIEVTDLASDQLSNCELALAGPSAVAGDQTAVPVDAQRPSEVLRAVVDGAGELRRASIPASAGVARSNAPPGSSHVLAA